MPHRRLTTANLHWQDDIPYASDFADVYFSKDDGFAESQYVFLQQNHLPQRFSSLENTHFTVAETGFGTGLNFLNTWLLWKKHYKTGKKLYYISAELYPLDKEALQQCLAHWPALAALSEKLYQQYPLPLAGMHCLEFEDGVTLILLFNDVVTGFTQLLESSHPNLAYNTQRSVDAWFLDGFSPKQNQAMWRDELFHLMAKLSHRQTTLATFTSAGFVRRGLRAAGFVCEKIKGFGQKREMLRADYQGLPRALEAQNKSRRRSAYGQFWPIYRQQQMPKTVAVIGAGITGCTTAWTLAQAGVKVYLLDRHARPMQEASGNPQAVLFPQLSSHVQSQQAQFNESSFLYALRFYQQTALQEAFHRCGVLDLIAPADKHAQALVERFNSTDFLQWHSADSASLLAQTTLNQAALYYPQAGFIDTQKLAQCFLNNALFEFKGGFEVKKIHFADQQWEIHSDAQILQTDAVILCNASAVNAFLETPLPLQHIRGQITGFKQEGLPDIQTIICKNNYLCPAIEQQYFCGATFDLNDDNPHYSANSEQENLYTLKQTLDDFHSISANRHRVGFRCATPDHLPLTGPIADSAFFTQHYADYRYNAYGFIPQLGAYQHGLFVNCAMSSRGFTSAPITAAILRAYLLNQPYPVPFTLMQALNPARFLIQNIAR